MKVLVIISLVAMVAACSSSGISRANVNSVISIRYATVVGVENVKLKSEAGKSTLIGGLWGLVSGIKGDREDMLGGAALGAAVLGLTTKISEGSSRAYAYMLQEKGGKPFKVMTDQGGIGAGDCVSIESSRMTNVRRVSSVYCDDVRPEGMLDKEIKQEAAQCLTAKQELLEAGSGELDALIRKVKAFCDD